MWGGDNSVGSNSVGSSSNSGSSNSGTVNTPAPNTPAPVQPTQPKPVPNKAPKRISSISIEPVNLTAGTTKTVNYTVAYTGELEDANTNDIEIEYTEDMDLLVNKNTKTVTLTAGDDITTKTVNFDVMSNGTKVGTLQVNLKESIRVTNIATTPDRVLLLKSKNKLSEVVNVGVNLSKETTDSSYYDILTEIEGNADRYTLNAFAYMSAVVTNNGNRSRQRTVRVNVNREYIDQIPVNTVLRIKSKKDQSKLIEIPLKYYNTEQDDPDYVAPTPTVGGNSY